MAYQIMLTWLIRLYSMAFLLNYGEFYERLRDLLQNNHPVSKYKFGNKVNGAMKDFDHFLDNTVKKYMDAFNAIQFVKAENVELRVLIDRLKKQIKDLNCEQDFLRMHLQEKDAKCHQLSRQKEKLSELFLYTIKDNPILIETKRLKVEMRELKAENNQLRSTVQMQKSRIYEKQKEMLEQRKILEQQLNILSQNCQLLQSKLQQQRRQSEKTVHLRLTEYKHGLQQANILQQSKWKTEMEALRKKKQLWKQRYYEQVGFIALIQENEDNKQ